MFRSVVCWGQYQAEGAAWGKRAVGEGAVPGEGTVQAFLFPLVTSWQIPKLERTQLR